MAGCISELSAAACGLLVPPGGQLQLWAGRINLVAHQAQETAAAAAAAASSSRVLRQQVDPFMAALAGWFAVLQPTPDQCMLCYVMCGEFMVTAAVVPTGECEQAEGLQEQPGGVPSRPQRQEAKGGSGRAAGTLGEKRATTGP